MRRPAPDRRRRSAIALLLILLPACSGSGHRTAGPATGAGTTTTTSAAPATVTSAPSSSVATTVAGATTTIGRCATAGLALRQNTASAATGHALHVFELGNTTTAACRLSGYPGVRVLDTSGATLADAQRTAGFILDDRPPATVSVAAGQSAYFGVESTNVCQGGGDPVPAASLRVTPPDDTASLTVAATLNVCPGGTTIIVSPVRATVADITRQ